MHFVHRLANVRNEVKLPLQISTARERSQWRRTIYNHSPSNCATARQSATTSNKSTLAAACAPFRNDVKLPLHTLKSVAMILNDQKRQSKAYPRCRASVREDLNPENYRDCRRTRGNDSLLFREDVNYKTSVTVDKLRNLKETYVREVFILKNVPPPMAVTFANNQLLVQRSATLAPRNLRLNRTSHYSLYAHMHSLMTTTN